MPRRSQSKLREPCDMFRLPSPPAAPSPPTPFKARTRMMVRALLCGLVTLLPAALGFVVPTASAGTFAGSRVSHVSVSKSATQRPTMSMERSYIMIKPDGVQRG